VADINAAIDRDRAEHPYDYDGTRGGGGGPAVVGGAPHRFQSVAVLERCGNPEALPVVEITTPEGSWYDYEHRYTEGLADHIMPAPLPEEQYSRTQEIAVLAFESLGCRDLSRADFVVPERGEPIILEVNTMPGMTPTSLFPDAAREAGISFEELVALLVERAVSRKS